MSGDQALERRVRDVLFERGREEETDDVLVDFRPRLGKPRRDASNESCANVTYQEAMTSAMAKFCGPVLLFLSGRDLTSIQSLEYCRSELHWRDLIKRSNVERRDLADADHTCSSPSSRHELEALTVDWIKRSFPRTP